MRAKVYLGVPSYGPIERETAIALFRCSKEHDIVMNPNQQSSLLALNFNMLWCEALNKRSEGVTHFVMLHADTAPEDFWIDKLMAEMRETRADLLSVISPIKDLRGLVSTGIYYPKTGELTRFTMSQIHELPETFSIADTPFPDQVLAVNTGCWVADITKPWVDAVDENNHLIAHFEIRDAIVKGPDGNYTSRNFSEDWNFSAQLARLGTRVYATRKIALTHYGRMGFGNDMSWGKQLVDAGGL
jgi:hypothetical protein